MGQFKKFLLFFFIAIFLNACGGLKRSDVKDNPINDADKRKKNIEEGRGISLKNLGKGLGSTNYEFSTSNPMWRASLETLDFLPLSTVDYSGGLIITDWYSEKNSPNESIKISIRFLSFSLDFNKFSIIIADISSGLMKSDSLRPGIIVFLKKVFILGAKQ